MNEDRATKAIQLRKNVESRIERARGIIQPALPTTVKFEEMKAKALLEIQSNPGLANATPVSVFWAFVHATSLGLSVSRVAEEAHIVPFSERGEVKAQLLIGYKGMAKLAYQHPKIIDINSYTVFDEDSFEVDLGSEPRISFCPDMDGKREQVRAAFCVVTILGRRDKVGKVMQLMTKAELDKVRASSRGNENPKGPWVNWYEEMCRKTVLRRTLKTVPRSSEIDRAMALEDSYEVGILPPGEVEVIDTQDKPKPRSARMKDAVSKQAAEVVEAELMPPDQPDF
jgi:recombination protein RecT